MTCYKVSACQNPSMLELQINLGFFYIRLYLPDCAPGFEFSTSSVAPYKIRQRATSLNWRCELLPVFSNTDYDNDWETLRDSIPEAATDVIGLKTNSKHDSLKTRPITRDLVDKTRELKLSKIK